MQLASYVFHTAAKSVLESGTPSVCKAGGAWSSFLLEKLIVLATLVVILTWSWQAQHSFSQISFARPERALPNNRADRSVPARGR